jgi:hypothetical protein
MIQANEVAEKLLQRAKGVTVVQLRAATGWKGAVRRGPNRIARQLKRKLVTEGKGEARRLFLAAPRARKAA